MYEVKQGRGQSFLSGIFGVCFAVCGGSFAWMARSGGVGPVLFSLMFVVIGLSIGIYGFWNAMAKNRPDVADITTSGQEPDPLNQRFGGN